MIVEFLYAKGFKAVSRHILAAFGHIIFHKIGQKGL